MYTTERIDSDFQSPDDAARRLTARGYLESRNHGIMGYWTRGRHRAVIRRNHEAWSIVWQVDVCARFRGDRR